MDSPRPKLGWIYQKSCFNQLKDSADSADHLSGISPAERLGSMFQSGLYSDCSFVVEEQEIRVHKLILAAASPKMEKMFLGAGEAQTEQIQVEYSVRVMQLILKHVYLQDMDIESIDEAQDVIEAACFFEMSDLVELCCAGIEPDTLDDLWPALNLACLYGSRPLKEACVSLALKHSDELISHPGLLHTSPEALAFLLSREIIHVNSELEVIETAVLWAQNRLANENETLQAESETRRVESATLRVELKDCAILQQLRILSLSEDDFNNFISNIGKEIFTLDELSQLEYNYFSDTSETFINPIRTERMLEHCVPICGTDYLAVNAETDNFSVQLKVFETAAGIRPTIKMIVLPSQINPANILYDNVSHRTHYNECILAEISVNDTVIGRGAFCDRIKYGDDVYITVNTFNIAALYSNFNYDEDERHHKFYEAKVRVVFKKHGYYPLAVETKSDDTALVVLEKPCRFIHEFILSYPRK